ncbi:MAG TPA: type II secretion system F family protein [Fimbriimonadaceae bacterium]|nr:type II secretion system F family protein [Fimbriimonadaceae bacterium]
MPYFAYTAIDASGRTVKAVMEADNEALVLSKLRDQSMHCTEIKRTKSAVKNGASKSKVKLKSMVIFSRQFATMIDAGIPILRCLEILSGQSKDKVFKPIIEAITADVKGGLSLNESIAKHPNVFNKLYINMIRAAEVGGILDLILDRLAGFLEYESEVKAKIKGAMMYPVLVLIFSQLMLFVMFSFVLPKFKEIFNGMNVELPTVTQTLFKMGDFCNHYWWVILLAVASTLFSIKMYGRTPRGRFQIDWIKLKIPVAGELALKMSIARFCRTFGTLINSGVPMMRSLEIVGETLGNVVLTQAIDQTRLSIREGNRLSVPMTQTGLFPTMVTTMIDIGEESGRLSEMLVKVGDFYDTEVEATIKGLTSMIEPLLIIFMGVIVGFIAISIMMPVFKLVSSVK